MEILMNLSVIKEVENEVIVSMIVVRNKRKMLGAIAVIQCNQKLTSFTAFDLVQFINKRYCEISDTQGSDSKLVIDH